MNFIRKINSELDLNGTSMNETEKRIAMNLLDKHSKLRGPADLENWIIAAQTFLVFYAAKEICKQPKLERAKNED